MEEVVQVAENLKKEWERRVEQCQTHIDAIEGYGKSGRGAEEVNSLTRLNSAAQDGLALLRSTIAKFRANTVCQDNFRVLENFVIKYQRESLTRHLMVQEVEITLATLEESMSIIRNAKNEYKGHRSLFMRTRHLLFTVRHLDVIDRVILVVGFLLYLLAVIYVVLKQIGLLELQRKLVAAIRSDSIPNDGVAVDAQRLGVGHSRTHEQADNTVPQAELPLPHI